MMTTDGLSDDARTRLLRLSELGPGDLTLGAELQRMVIAPRVPRIIADFYARLRQHPEARVHIPDHATQERLQRLIGQYLRTLGVDVATPAYFAERHRVGVAHARVGIDLGLYQLAMHWLWQSIEDACQGEHDPDLLPLLRYCRAVLALDAAIGAEAYHEHSLERLRSSLATLTEKIQRDPLTGMASREYIDAHLAAACLAATSDAPVAIVVADLDRFKRVNDDHGHLVGDEVLQETARRIAGAVRDGDLVGRWGGEEFLLVLRGSDSQEAMQVAERVRCSVNEEPVTTSAGQIRVSISQGVAVTTGADEPRALVERADLAMYEAKRSGRNRVVGPR